SSKASDVGRTPGVVARPGGVAGLVAAAPGFPGAPAVVLAFEVAVAPGPGFAAGLWRRACWRAEALCPACQNQIDPRAEAMASRPSWRNASESGQESNPLSCVCATGSMIAQAGMVEPWVDATRVRPSGVNAKSSTPCDGPER